MGKQNIELKRSKRVKINRAEDKAEDSAEDSAIKVKVKM